MGFVNSFCLLSVMTSNDSTLLIFSYLQGNLVKIVHLFIKKINTCFWEMCSWKIPQRNVFDPFTGRKLTRYLLGWPFQKPHLHILKFAEQQKLICVFYYSQESLCQDVVLKTVLVLLGDLGGKSTIEVEYQILLAGYNLMGNRDTYTTWLVSQDPMRKESMTQMC